MSRKKTVQKDFMDTGTPQMARKFTIVPRLSSPTTTTMKVLDGCEIDAMLMNDLITPAQHSTLMHFAKKLLTFGFSTLRSPDYSSPIFSDATAVADKKANTIRGAVHLFARLDKHPYVGKYRRKKLVNLVLEDIPWGNKRNQIEELHAIIRAVDEVLIGR